VFLLYHLTQALESNDKAETHVWFVGKAEFIAICSALKKDKMVDKVIENKYGCK